MDRLHFCLYTFSDHSFRRGFFYFIPTLLALITSLFTVSYISYTSKLFATTHQHHHHLPFVRSFPISSNATIFTAQVPPATPSTAATSLQSPGPASSLLPLFSEGNGSNFVNNDEFHSKAVFSEDYKAMNRSFKIYVYPHRKDEPFANVLLPIDVEPGGNHASESYFKQVLKKSHFITKDASKADLFSLPFSIARLRYDKRVGVAGIPDFVRVTWLTSVKDILIGIEQAELTIFSLRVISIGRSATEKAVMVKSNAIQVVYSSSYFLSGYITHKDASIPQIWPRQGDPDDLISSKRKKLAFFLRDQSTPQYAKSFLKYGKMITRYLFIIGCLTNPYADELLGSKFCLHVKGFEVNTARIADSLYNGCVPVIIANHYDLPFADIWKTFSIVVATLDIPLLKDILHQDLVSTVELEKSWR